MTMKKLFTILALGAGIICANAQSVKGNKFADNWTLGISGGVITPTTNHAFFGSMRPTITLEASKWLTPVYALAVQGQTGFNYDKIGSMMPASEFARAKRLLMPHKLCFSTNSISQISLAVTKASRVCLKLRLTSAQVTLISI